MLAYEQVLDKLEEGMSARRRLNPWRGAEYAESGNAMSTT